LRVGGPIRTRKRLVDVLNRRRGLLINTIRRLHERLGISAETLIRPPRGGQTG
jgi:HTH-type transcriptional regulator/antitoxin HigA